LFALFFFNGWMDFHMEKCCLTDMEDTHWWVYLSKFQPTKRRGERRKKKMIAAILKYRSSALTCQAFTATLQQQLQLARGSRYYAMRRKECAESGVKLNQIAIFIHISIGYFSWVNILRNCHME
jgi:hypothetical protein